MTPRKSRERLDAEAARELLQRRYPDTAPQENTDEDVALFWIIQLKIVGRPWRGEGDPPADWNARATRLAELHPMILAQLNNPALNAEHDRIMEEICDEAHQELAERKKLVAAGKLKSIHHTAADSAG